MENPQADLISRLGDPDQTPLTEADPLTEEQRLAVLRMFDARQTVYLKLRGRSYPVGRLCYDIHNVAYAEGCCDLVK